MFVTTLIAATVAAAEPSASGQAPAQPHADHKAMGHGGQKMACCEEMAKGEDCCCKSKGKDAGGPSSATSGGQAHDH